MSDPLAFLRAAHAEAQAEAEAATPGPWWYIPGKQWLGLEAFERYDLTKGDEFVGYGGPSPFVGAVAATGPADSPQSVADARFIAHHDPAAVLRRIAADRKILALHDMAHECSSTDWISREHDPCCWIPESETCDTIRALAEGWGWTAD